MFKKYQLSICSLFLAGLLLSPISAVSADEDVVAPSSETEQVVDNTNNSSEVAVDEDVVLPSSESESTDEETIEVTEVAAEEASGGGEDEQPTDPEYVFGRDDRIRVVNPSRSPYRQTVFVQSRFGRDYGGGSGVLIAPDKVLTAAHVLRDSRTGRWADGITVIPGMSGAITPYDVRNSSIYHIFNDYYNDFSLEYTTTKMNNDIAVITLDEPFSPYVGYLSIHTGVQLNQRIQVIGYPQSDWKEDIGKHNFMYAASGVVSNISEKTITHQVDTTPGHSGGPVVDESYRLLGITLSGNSQRNTALRIDNRVLQMIDYANKNLQTNQEFTKFRGVYQLYHPQKKYYFYTVYKSEADRLVKAGWFYPITAWTSNTKGREIYRYYNPSRQKHIFTANQTERVNLKKAGWRYEGVAFYSNGRTPVYRLFHGGEKTHFYTADENEKNQKINEGWKYEGLAWYAE